MDAIELYQAVVDTLPIHVAVLDRHGAIMAVNRAWRVFAAENGLLQHVQWHGMSYLDACQRSDDDGASHMCAGIEAVLDGSRLRFEAEYPCHAPAGQHRWFRLTAVPFALGGERHTLVLHHDVTHRRIELQRLGDERNRLETEVRQMQKLEAVGRLAGGVAHDFNNLLMGISGTANVALKRVALDDSLRFALDQIRSAAIAGTAITKQLLSFSRKHQRDAELHELDAAILRNEGMLRQLIGESFTLDVSLHCTGSGVVCTEGELEQVLMNLVVNARDAMPGGGLISVHTTRILLAADDVRPGELPPGPYCVLVVEDEGRGMDAATRERIFEPFFTTKDQASGSGTGLGLSTVFGIVCRSRGHIEVHSEPGQGSSFRVYLPTMSMTKHDAPPRLTRAAELDGHGERVLVVEDDHLVRDTVREHLRGAGYEVLEASDGLKALQLCRELDHLDLVITDMVLPGTTGTELAQRLVTLRPEARVMLMSAHPREVLLQARRLAPDDELLHKPFTEHELLAAVRRLVPADNPELGAERASRSLPVVPSTILADPAPAAMADGRVALLLEDDRINREAMVGLLEDAGWVVRAADCGARALELVEASSFRPSTIVSDFSLPDGHGPEVIARLDALGCCARVVYLSGRSPDSPEVRAALARPRTRFVQKPVDCDALLAELERS